MSKTLIAYFSATGTTAGMAKTLSEDIGADLYEIKPENPYSQKDLNWVNPFSRTMKEYLGKTKVAVADQSLDIMEYDTVILGFPIWFFKEPNVILAFLCTASQPLFLAVSLTSLILDNPMKRPCKRN